MAIKIIKKGTKLKEIKQKVYKIECEECGCIFEFNETDVEVWDHPCHDYDETVRCPQCKKLISVYKILKEDE